MFICLNETDPIDVIKEVVWNREDGSMYPFYVFADIEDTNYTDHYGRNLANYIKKNKLGDVVATQKRVNPNSGNRIQSWLWTVNKRNLRLFA